MSEPETEAIQVVIVGDQPALSRGVEMLLTRQGFRVTGSAPTAEAGARMIHARKPSVALIDIEATDGSGPALVRKLLAEEPGTASVLYTGALDDRLIGEALESGACGVVLKSARVDELVAAITAAADGTTYVDRRAMGIAARPRRRSGEHIISPREVEVLELLVSGLSCRGVAEELCVAVSTVQTHVRNAVRKLGATGQLHAVVLALRAGEIELGAEDSDQRLRTMRRGGRLASSAATRSS
jgi:DNA-binding NarL/FixJ family response regulator